MSASNRSQYSWTAPSTQSSKSIIKSSDESTPKNEKTDSSLAHEQPAAPPVIPRRSSYNYAQDSAQFSSLGNNPSAGSTKEQPAGGVEGLQKKLFHERKKSYTMEDQKRTRHEHMLKSNDRSPSFSEV